MTETRQSGRVGRSIVALLAGMLAGIVLSLGTDIVLHAIGFFPPWGQPVDSPPLLVATAYRAIYGVLSSYIAARLAPNRPMEHALLLGFVGLIVSAFGAVITWNKGAAFGPHWYPVVLIVLAIPTAWAGGKLFVSQIRNSAEA